MNIDYEFEFFFHCKLLIDLLESDRSFSVRLRLILVFMLLSNTKHFHTSYLNIDLYLIYVYIDLHVPNKVNKNIISGILIQ